MAKEAKEIIEYSEEVQKLLIQFMISSSESFVRCQSIIKASYWNDRLRPAVKYVLQFVEDYNTLPSSEQILAESSVEIIKVDNAELYSDWFLDTIEQFCRHKAMEALIYDGPKLLEKGEYSELERRSKENMMISLNKELGTDYFDNPLERLLKMKNRTGMISTGWKTIDEKLYGGFNRGELNIWAAPSGGGKSLFLQNLAINWSLMGLNVVYISLELSEDLIGLRLDAMLMGVSTKQVFKDMEDVALRLGIMAKTGTYGKKPGKIQIKKMPEAGTSVNVIRAYLKEYEVQTGIRPDALLIDYLDLLYPNSNKVDINSAFNKDKYVSEEMRALAFEWNIYISSASQLNRSAVNEQDYDMSHIAGGISKINTADNLMGIFSTTAMKERGEYQIQFLKTRSSSGVGSKVYLKYDPNSLRISDMEEGETTSHETGLANIQNQLQKHKIQQKIETPPANQSIGSNNLASMIRAAAARNND
jgi:archaellum biogenesis ATPase FlaH